MNCEFKNITCGISGNFVCKKCTACGHEVGMTTAFAETRWDEIRAGIVSKCQVRPRDPAAADAPAAALTESPPATAVAPPDAGNGPGAYLKKYLGRIGIKAAPNCSCNARAKYMDFMGTVWCENNIDTIVGWLKEESEKRKMPFIDWPARTLVKKAIAASKKAQAKQFEEQSNNDVQPPTA